MTARERFASASLRHLAIPAALAVALFVLAYDDGAYSPRTQAAAGVIVWWAILLAAIVTLARAERMGGAARRVTVALVGLAAWTLASSLWASSAEASVVEFNRILLYLGIFLVVAVLARPGTAGSWADGLAAGISAIAVVALASRLFPSLFSQRGLATFLPSAQTRLSFPLGYWNGLGIFCALAVPLLFRSAVVARSWLLRGLALAPVPVIVADIYLASSRGAVATLLTGTIVLLVASNRRWPLVGAMAAAAAGSALTIAVLVGRNELVDGPLTGAAAQSEGRSAAVLIALACIATAAAYAAGYRYWPARLIPSRTVGRAAAAAAIALAVAFAFAAHPVRRFEAFKQVPQFSPLDSADFVRAHLLSGNGSGRWQFWSSAVDEWRSRLWTGRGAGSYEAWWAAHGSLPNFVKDAHSLYLQTLGELGVVGLALLLGVLLGGASAGVSRVRRAEGEARVTNSALLAVLAAYAVAAGIEWMWQLTVVSVVAFVCLGLLAGAATSRPRRARRRPEEHVRGRTVAVAAVAAAALFAFASEGDQLLAQARIHSSQSATAHGNLEGAFTKAVDARDLQPWAATPYLQIALVAEQRGELVTASQAIAKATDRAPDDWRLWLVRARIETKRGLVAAGVRALERARDLNPRSPLLAAGS